MKIGVIGTGRMGAGLGGLWAAAGHEVMFGSRDAGKAQDVAGSVGSGARGGSVEDAAAFGDVVLLAVPYGAAAATLEGLAEGGALTGKVVVDLTNPVAGNQDGLGLGLAVWGTGSGGEEMAAAAPGALVVKAFNHIYSRVFSSASGRDFGPDGTDVATAFLCGDDEGAKSTVGVLARDMGFEPVDIGPLSMARCLEPFALLMIRLQFLPGMSADTAVKLLRHQVVAEQAVPTRAGG